MAGLDVHDLVNLTECSMEEHGSWSMEGLLVMYESNLHNIRMLRDNLKKRTKADKIFLEKMKPNRVLMDHETIEEFDKLIKKHEEDILLSSYISDRVAGVLVQVKILFLLQCTVLQIQFFLL